MLRVCCNVLRVSRVVFYCAKGKHNSHCDYYIFLSVFPFLLMFDSDNDKFIKKLHASCNCVWKPIYTIHNLTQLHMLIQCADLN